MPKQGRWRRHRERLFWAAAVLLMAAALVGSRFYAKPPTPPLTQQDIDNAVMHTLETKTLPSQASRAYEAVGRSVVLVRGTHAPAAGGEGEDTGKVERT
ncbi:MAG: peptidase, partial [Rhizobacter sp.]|nr:peptidase [Rhizobacter sp.]